MNLIKITFEGNTFYHAKKGLASGNSLRLTRNIEEAQTYNSPGSASRGVKCFEADIRQSMWRNFDRRGRWSNFDPADGIVAQVLRGKRAGEPIHVSIVEARIVEGNQLSHQEL